MNDFGPSQGTNSSLCSKFYNWYSILRPIYLCFFPYRQCRCIFKDQLHLARLEDLLQHLLKCAIDRICELRVPAVEDGKKASGSGDVSGSAVNVDSDNWTQPEKERLFLAVGKIFQLPFPFYQVRKIHLLRQVCTQIYLDRSARQVRASSYDPG